MDLDFRPSFIRNVWFILWSSLLVYLLMKSESRNSFQVKINFKYQSTSQKLNKRKGWEDELQWNSGLYFQMKGLADKDFV